MRDTAVLSFEPSVTLYPLILAVIQNVRGKLLHKSGKFFSAISNFNASTMCFPGEVRQVEPVYENGFRPAKAVTRYQGNMTLDPELASPGSKLLECLVAEILSPLGNYEQRLGANVIRKLAQG